jgi:hypothetical protein
MKGLLGKLCPDVSDEYIIGVLEPKSFRRGAIAHFGSPVIAGAQDINRANEPEETDYDDEDTDYGTGPKEITPELDPRTRTLRLHP